MTIIFANILKKIIQKPFEMKKSYRQTVKHKVQNKNHSQHSVFIDFYFFARKISLLPAGPGNFSMVKPAALRVRFTIPLVE